MKTLWEFRDEANELQIGSMGGVREAWTTTEYLNAVYYMHSVDGDMIHCLSEKADKRIVTEKEAPVAERIKVTGRT
jgi:hypothetical protein